VIYIFFFYTTLITFLNLCKIINKGRGRGGGREGGRERERAQVFFMVYNGPLIWDLIM